MLNIPIAFALLAQEDDFGRLAGIIAVLVFSAIGGIAGKVKEGQEKKEAERRRRQREIREALEQRQQQSGTADQSQSSDRSQRLPQRPTPRQTQTHSYDRQDEAVLTRVPDRGDEQRVRRVEQDAEADYRKAREHALRKQRQEKLREQKLHAQQEKLRLQQQRHAAQKQAARKKQHQQTPPPLPESPHMDHVAGLSSTSRKSGSYAIDTRYTGWIIDREEARRAIIFKEILGPPVSMRESIDDIPGYV